MSLRKNIYYTKLKLKRRWNRFKYGNCTVLLYHRVYELDYDPQQLCVSATNFKEQLKFLKSKYHFLTIEQFNDHLLQKKPFRRNSMLITFDDGYADNLRFAIPILEETGLQALFYISTKNLNTLSLFWWDELDLLFKEGKKMNDAVLKELFKSTGKNNTKELYQHYLNLLKRSQSLGQREADLNTLRKLRAISDEEKAPYICLRFDELKKLASSKSAIIGAHTIDHLSLSCLNEEDQRKQILGSMTALKEILNIPIEYFSYPYGEKHDYNETSVNICKELKLKHAAANYGGYMDSESDRYAFTRFVVRNDAPEILEKKLKDIL